MRDRELVLKEDPLRYQALPHMMTAQWDTLELLMEEQAAGYPRAFHALITQRRSMALDQPSPLGIDDTASPSATCLDSAL